MTVIKEVNNYIKRKYFRIFKQGYLWHFALRIMMDPNFSTFKTSAVEHFQRIDQRNFQQAHSLQQQ